MIKGLIIFIFLIISLQFLYSNIKLLAIPAQDFEVFYLSGKSALSGKNPYLQLDKDIVRNPPPVIVIFTLLTSFPILISQTIWFVLSFLAFLTGSLFLFKIIQLEFKKDFKLVQNWKVWFIYLSLVFTFFPFRYNLGSGQVNNFLFLFLVLGFYFYKINSPFASAFSLTLGIILKLTPILFILPFAIMREFRLTKLVIISALVIFLISLPVIGLKTYIDYLSIPGSFFNFSLSVYTNQSIIGFLARAFNNNLLVKIIYAIISIFVLATLAFISRKYSKLATWNISILTMLVIAPFAWQYHFVITIFPLTTTFFILYFNKFPKIYFLLLFLSYLLLGWNIKNPGVAEKQFLGAVVLSHVLWGSILLMLLNLKIKSEKS